MKKMFYIGHIEFYLNLALFSRAPLLNTCISFALDAGFTHTVIDKNSDKSQIICQSELFHMIHNQI